MALTSALPSSFLPSSVALRRPEHNLRRREAFPERGVAPSTRHSMQEGIRMQVSEKESSAGTLSDQFVSSAEEVLRVAGVDTSEPRLSLALSVGAQASRKIEKGLLELVGAATRYTTGARQEAEPSTWEEALMTVPDLETIPYRVLQKINGIEIREVQSYLVAETRMTSSSQGFDFIGSSQGFNTLAEYLFGKNKGKRAMEMTTPVISQRNRGDAMEMTTPVITRKTKKGIPMEMTTPVINSKGGKDGWAMSFVIPSEFNEETVPIPDDGAVSIKRIPARMVAAVAFSGYVTDGDVAARERRLRDSIAQMEEYTVAAGAELEVSQFNPPFTPPFMRRNEISIEVVKRE